MSGWTPKPWLIRLPKPEELEGYADAVATLARGESLFPDQPKRAPIARVKRTVESLTAERDRLVAERDAINIADSGDTAGARLNLSGMRRHYKNTDAHLQRHTKLTARIDALNFRIGNIA